MRHVVRIAVKFVACLIVLGIILGIFFDFSFGDVLLISAVLGVVSYFIGDLFILRATNNFFATATDFVLAFIVIWLMGRAVTYENNLISAALISAAVVAMFEYMFHTFLMKESTKQTTIQQTQTKPIYQTEAAEEITPSNLDVKSFEKKDHGSKDN